MQMNWTALAVAGLVGVAALGSGDTRNKMKLPSFAGVAEVRSSLPGRMRLGMSAIALKPELALQMKEQLENTGVVERVTLNPRIGSVLIEYHPDQVEPAVLEGAAIKLMGLDEEIRKHPLCRVDEGIRSLLNAVDYAVYERTNGLLDARVLAGGALCAMAVHSAKLSGWAVPGAMTLLWWASSLWRNGDHE